MPSLTYPREKTNSKKHRMKKRGSRPWRRPANGRNAKICWRLKWNPEKKTDFSSPEAGNQKGLLAENGDPLPSSLRPQ
jgi:hypothetical protein